MPSFNDVFSQVTGGRAMPGNVQANRAGAFNSIANSFHPGQYAQVNAQIAAKNPSSYTSVPDLNAALKGGQINKNQWNQQFRVIQNKTTPTPKITTGVKGNLNPFNTQSALSQSVNKVLLQPAINTVKAPINAGALVAAEATHNNKAITNSTTALQNSALNSFISPLAQTATMAGANLAAHSILNNKVYSPAAKTAALQQAVNPAYQKIGFNLNDKGKQTALKGASLIAQDIASPVLTKGGQMALGAKFGEGLGVRATNYAKAALGKDSATNSLLTSARSKVLLDHSPAPAISAAKTPLTSVTKTAGESAGKGTPAIDALSTKPPLDETGGISLPNTNDYVKQQIKLQDAARKAGTSNPIVAAKSEAKQKLVDSFAPIEDTLNKSGAKVAPENNIKYQIDRAIRGDTIGAQYIKDNGLAKVIQSAPNTKELDQYLIAKHAADLEKNGVQTGRNLLADQQLVKDLGPKYEAHAQAVKEYSNNLLDKATEYGLVSKDVATGLKAKYPNYVPVNRIFGEGELPGAPKGTGQGMASLGSQSVVQKIKGSTRQIESPLSNLVDKTVDVIKQGERNKAAQILTGYHTLPGNPFDITPLRTAENVQARIDVFSQAKELKPVQNQLNRLISRRSGWARQLQSQLDQLNKKGLQASLAKSVAKTEAPILTGKAEVLKGVKVAQAGRRSMPILTGTAGHHQLFTRSMTAQETKGMVNNLLNMPSRELEAINKKIASRDSKLKPIMSEISDLRTTVEGVKNNRQVLMDEGHLLRDAESRGKTTISAMRNGIKEIYETSPAIADAAKSLNKEQLGLIGKILSVPTRVLRLGATGLNPAFALANVSKDTVSAFINTSHALRASPANPKVFMQALIAAVNHGSKQYGELVREGAGGTSFDIARNAPKQNVKAIRAERNLPSKIAYTVTRPAQLLRAAENTIGRSEEFNRAIQYFGNKDAFAKKGYDAAQTRTLAANAARNNTVNFARAGDYGRVINSTLPYFNAGIQGSRTLLRNLKDRPLQTGAKLAVSTFFPVAAVTVWNTSDPNRKAAYDDIKDYEKQGNLIIVPPHPVKDPNTGKWNVIKIPMSQEIANLANIVRNGTEAAVKDKKINVAQVLGNAAGTVTSLNTQSPRQLANQLTPQAIKPGIEAMTNQNLYTGNKIVPDSQRNLPAKDQTGLGTSKTAIKVGQVTGLSPRHIDNAIATGTGGLGKSLAHGKSLSSQVSDRFKGAQGNSKYDLADARFNALKTQFTDQPGYKSMSSQDKAKALNRLQSAVSKALVPTPGKKLSARQQAIVDKRPNLTDYLKAKR